MGGMQWYDLQGYIQAIIGTFIRDAADLAGFIFVYKFKVHKFFGPLMDGTYGLNQQGLEFQITVSDFSILCWTARTPVTFSLKLP